jgi:ATP-dependent helicase/nuclease subunit A
MSNTHRLAQPEGTNWTAEQWQAITARGQDILVAAAAGSGKTAVLVERIIKRITEEEDPVDVDRLLIVTFTNAAAAEMRKRMGEALERELIVQPDSLFLRRQLTLLQRASVSTLHSFCLDVLRRYYFKVDLDPKFRIADDTEAELLREEVLEELFEEQYSQIDNEQFYKLVDSFSNDRSDDELYTGLLKLYDFSRSHPFPHEWLDQMVERYGKETEEGGFQADQSFWTQEILADLQLQLKSYVHMLEKAMNITREPAGPAPYAENLVQDMNILQELSRAVKESWEATYQAFQELKFANLKACRGDQYDKALQDQVKSIRNLVKDKLGVYKEELFMRPLQEYMEDVYQMAPLMYTLVELTKKFGYRYSLLKKEKALVDFADLEHYCLAILQDEASSSEELIPSEAALEYRQKFAEVMVDEYQDTNFVQESIIRLVTRRDSEGFAGNLFMVGDVKQSIYRFRLAEPGLFLSKYKEFGYDNKMGLKIDLARNFRSRSEVLHGTNYIFKQIMNETVGEIDYDEDAMLKVGADYPLSSDMQVEMLLIDRNGDHSNEEGTDTQSEASYSASRSSLDFDEADVEDEYNENNENNGNGNQGEREIGKEEFETVQLEARVISQQIKRLLGHNGKKPFEVYDAKQKLLRPIQYRDIVILLRATSSWAPTILEECKQQGIPAYAELSTGYFDATEVAVMMSLLKIIDNPFQDIPLASVLRSPIVGLDENDMAWIRIQKRSGSYYEALLACLTIDSADTDEASESHSESEDNSFGLNETDDKMKDRNYKRDTIKRKLSTFVKQLDNWRTKARQGSLSDLIWQLFRETGYFDFVGGMPGGNQRQANLRALYDRARQYESTSFRGLFRFLRFINRMKDKGRDLGTARALGEQEDVVRLMTIHKSKGLEFPVVFIAGLGKMFNMQDLNQKFLMHKELGFGSKFIDVEKRISYPMLPQLTIRRRMHMELLAEEMRVLYVALTRAKEKLFLIGTVKDRDKKIEEWSSHLSQPQWLLADFERAKARCYLDWIGPCLVRHQDASTLRGEGQCDFLEVVEHASSWKVSFIQTDQLRETLTERDKLDQKLYEALLIGDKVPHMSDLHEQVNKRLSWRYVYKEAQSHLAKQSVTELKRQMEWYTDPETIQMGVQNPAGTAFTNDQGNQGALSSRGTLSDRPRFLQSAKLTASERGTALHMVMQHLSVHEQLSRDDIQQCIFMMVENELLTQQQADAVDVATLYMFTQSELGQRITQAKAVRKEIPFSLGVAANEVFNDWPEGKEELVLVQGVADCVLEEEDGLVLIDYKTDRMPRNLDIDAILSEQYKVQLDIYAKALEQIWNKPVKEKYLYFFDGGHILKL